MLKYLNSVIVALLLFSFCSCKKDLLHWQKVQQLTSNTTSRLNNIKFISNDICLIAGGELFLNSTVLRSTDGGYSWAANSYPDAAKGMYGFSFSAEGVIYLCGIDGDVLHSSDSGQTFQFNRIGDWEYYVGASFPTPDTGIFVSTHLNSSGSITRVDRNYTIIDKLELAFGTANIYMTGRDTGYVIGYGAVLKTTDRGNNWRYQDPADDKFTCLDIKGNDMWLCGYAGSVYHTDDGGAHWDKRRNGNDITLPRYRMLSIVFKDKNKGWASCDDGTVVYTEDGGHHWSEYDRFTTMALRSIAICPNNDLLVAGDGGVVYRLTTK